MTHIKTPNHYLFLGIILILLFGITSCRENLNKKYAETTLTVNIIPKPEKLMPKKGIFLIHKNTGLTISNKDEKVQSVADLFLATINQASGYNLTRNAGDHSIKVVLNKSLSKLGSEGYKLDVSDDDSSDSEDEDEGRGDLGGILGAV